MSPGWRRPSVEPCRARMPAIEPCRVDSDLDRRRRLGGRVRPPARRRGWHLDLGDRVDRARRRPLLSRSGSSPLAAAIRPRSTPHARPGRRCRHDGVYRVLVVADESLANRVVTEEIVPRAGGGRLEAFVVAPELRSRLAHWTGDDSKHGHAERHPQGDAERVRGRGVPANGTVGSTTRSRLRTTPCAPSRRTKWSS